MISLRECTASFLWYIEEESAHSLSAAVRSIDIQRDSHIPGSYGHDGHHGPPHLEEQ